MELSTKRFRLLSCYAHSFFSSPCTAAHYLHWLWEGDRSFLPSIHVARMATSIIRLFFTGSNIPSDDATTSIRGNFDLSTNIDHASMVAGEKILQSNGYSLG